jgi:Na+/pantothenate symporter
MSIGDVLGALMVGLVGLGLFVAGAWGSLHIPRLKIDVVLTLKQRFYCTIMGLLLMVSTYINLRG